MRQWRIEVICAMTVSLACLTVSSACAELFRCGNTYQDHPCEGSQTSKPVPGAGTGKPRAAAAAGNSAGGKLHPVCAKRGVDSQKVVWSREAGARLDKMLEGETDASRKRLIGDVYRERGTAPEVRSRIESECQTEMEENERSLKLRDAMVRAGALPDARPAAGSGETQPQAAKEPDRRELDLQQKERKKERCDRIAEKIKQVRDDQRQGGSTNQMETLNSKMRELDAEARTVKCND